jgi:hypothetical protein
MAQKSLMMTSSCVPQVEIDTLEDLLLQDGVVIVLEGDSVVMLLITPM